MCAVCWTRCVPCGTARCAAEAWATLVVPPCLLCHAQIEALLGRKLDSIYEGNASALRVLSVVGPEGFLLRDRALHVYSEAGRVYAFRDVCKVRFLAGRGRALVCLLRGRCPRVTAASSLVPRCCSLPLHMRSLMPATRRSCSSWGS